MEFNTVDEAQEAYTAMKGQEIDGRQIFVDFAGERGSNNCCEYLTFKVKYTILSWGRNLKDVWECLILDLGVFFFFNLKHSYLCMDKEWGHMNNEITYLNF